MDKQQPVAWLDAEMSQAYTIDELPDASGTGFLPLYTAPPKKQWVGLTDEEVNELVARFKRYSYVLLREVEAKLKEKNT